MKWCLTSSTRGKLSSRWKVYQVGFFRIHEATRWSLCPESSRFRVHGSGFCVHGSGFTVEGSRFLSLFTVHVSQFWVHGSRFPIHSSQSTVHSSQFTVHSSQFTVYRLRDTKKWIISTVLCRKIALIHLVMRSLHMKKWYSLYTNWLLYLHKIVTVIAKKINLDLVRELPSAAKNTLL